MASPLRIGEDSAGRSLEDGPQGRQDRAGTPVRKPSRWSRGQATSRGEVTAALTVARGEGIRNTDERKGRPDLTTWWPRRREKRENRGGRRGFFSQLPEEWNRPPLQRRRLATRVWKGKGGGLDSGAGEAGRLFGHVWFCRRGNWTQDAEIRESDVRSKYESGNRHVQMVFESRRDDIGRDTKARDGLAVTAPRPGGGGRPRRGPRGSSQHEPGGHVSETPAAKPRVRAAPGRHVVILMACCAHLPELVGGKRGGHTQPPLVGLL